MKKLLDKLFSRLGYVPKSPKPTFNFGVYTVYQEKINELYTELEVYKKLSAEKNEQLPEMLMLAEVRIESLRRENQHLYRRLKHHNILWSDDTMPYVIPYDEEFFTQLEKDALWKSSTAKKSKKSKMQEN